MAHVNLQRPRAWATLGALAAAVALLAAAPQARAQAAGSWAVKLGWNQISPQVDSETLSAPSLPGTRVDVKADSAPIATVTYHYTEHLSVEAFAGLAYKHDVVGAGTVAGTGRLATLKQVSPTVFAQYRFLPASAALRPYMGIGPTYAYFFDEEGSGTLTALTNPGGPATRVSVDAAWGLSAQLGATWALQHRWFLDAAVVKTYVKTTTRLSTGQTIDTRLDPVSFNLSVGYRF